MEIVVIGIIGMEIVVIGDNRYGNNRSGNNRYGNSE
jgi:hypothetical protein